MPEGKETSEEILFSQLLWSLNNKGSFSKNSSLLQTREILRFWFIPYFVNILHPTWAQWWGFSIHKLVRLIFKCILSAKRVGINSEPPIRFTDYTNSIGVTNLRTRQLIIPLLLLIQECDPHILWDRWFVASKVDVLILFERLFGRKIPWWFLLTVFIFVLRYLKVARLYLHTTGNQAGLSHVFEGLAEFFILWGLIGHWVLLDEFGVVWTNVNTASTKCLLMKL